MCMASKQLQHTTTRGLRVVGLRVHPGYGVACGSDGYQAVRLLDGGETQPVGKLADTFQGAVSWVRRDKNPQDGNPWIAVHMSGEMDFTGDGYTARAARQLVLGEYAGAPEPVDCECGGEAWYRATIGAMKCPACGNLYTCNGELID